MITKLNIFGKIYRVLCVPLDNKHLQVKGTECNGTANTDACTIAVLKTLDPQQQREVLIHECIHCISDELDLRLTEKQVVGLSVGLYALLKNNPKMLKR